MTGPTVTEIMAAYDLARLLWLEHHKTMPAGTVADGRRAWLWLVQTKSNQESCQELWHRLATCDISSFRSGWERCYHEAYGPT